MPSGRHGSGSSYVYRKGSPPPPEKPEQTMGVREWRDNVFDQIRAGLEASDCKIVLIVSRDHQDNEEGSWHADKIKLPSGERGWAHVAIAFVGPDGRPIFMEKTPGKGLGPLISPNKSGTVEDFAKYREFEIIPLDFSKFPPGARERFINAFLEALSRPYSAISGFGDHCSSAFGKALYAAMNPGKTDGRISLKPALFPNIYTPNDAYLHGKKYSVPSATIRSRLLRVRQSRTTGCTRRRVVRAQLRSSLLRILLMTIHSRSRLWQARLLPFPPRLVLHSSRESMTTRSLCRKS
jgi:hypothetical protein